MRSLARHIVINFVVFFLPQRKRPRVSIDDAPTSRRHTPREDESSSSEEEIEDADDTHRTVPSSPPMTQYELMRDDGFKHLENPEWDDWEAEQKIQNRPPKLTENTASDSGIIESITCVNFMCHEKLHVELGPLINFVVGENGSGKSAVLTALTLCLGGKASDTNRGGSMKSFIKEGRDHGFLRVKVKNAGTDAYHPDVYGDSITIERHFAKSGASGFKIISERGKVISTKKQEVEEISEWYALQMGNPLTVLSQDNARQFLNSATPAQKYKYFVSGVQLEQLDNDYKMSVDTLDRTESLRGDLTTKVESIKKEMEQAERLSETAQKNTTLREKSRHYRNQLVWSQVVEQERALEQRNADLVTRDGRIADVEQECEDMTRALAEVEEKLERVKAVREALNGERDLLTEKIKAAEAAFGSAKNDLTEVHREERDAHTRLKNLRQEIKACEAKISSEEQRLGESTGGARAAKEAEHEEASREAQEITDKITLFNQQLPELQAEVGTAQQESKRQKQFIEAKRQAIVETESSLRDLQKNTTSKYSGYDQDMINLVKEVERHTGFESKPVGPLGAHIKLLRPEWSGIMEKTLGEALNAFVVRSKRDQSLLSSLIRKRGMKRAPPVYIAYGGRFDTRSQEPDAKFDTILRILEFEDDIIRSQLIINSQIEKIILIPDRVEAEAVMVDNDGPPRNVSACICFHDGRGKRGQGLRLTNRNGTIGTSPMVPTGQRPRMQADSGGQLAVVKENARLLALELRDLNAEDRAATENLKKCEAKVVSHRREIKEMERELRHKQADMEKISTELDSFEGVDDRLISLRTELEGKRAEEEQLGIQYGNMNLTKADLSRVAEQKKRSLEEARREGETYDERVIKAQNKVESHESMRRIAVSKKNASFENADIERAERARAEAKRDQKAAEVEEFIEKAQELAPVRVHIGEGETYQSIEAKYQKISEQLAARERRQGATDQEIFDRAAEARQTYQDVLLHTEDVDMTIAALKISIGGRLHMWRSFQRQISARIRTQFNYLLSERGFRGRIDLQHKEKLVTLHIEPDNTKKSGNGRDTKTLSGGEKSFSSICMLLSIWEAIGSPIRCLDEFDVFMDNVNRAISTKMLVDVARRSVSRQYILITPNAIEGRAELGKDVKIIR